MAHHTSIDCKFREVACEFCQKQVVFVEQKQHESVCPAFRITCDRCAMVIRRSELPDHDRRLCIKRSVPCTFAHIGCTWSGAFDIQDEHYSDVKSLSLHFMLLATSHRDLQSRTTALELQLSDYKDELQALRSMSSVGAKEVKDKDAKDLKYAAWPRALSWITDSTSAVDRWLALENVMSKSELPFVLAASTQYRCWLLAEVIKKEEHFVMVRFLGMDGKSDKFVNEFMDIYGGRLRPLFPSRSDFVEFIQCVASGDKIDFYHPQKAMEWRSGVVLSVTPSAILVKDEGWSGHVTAALPRVPGFFAPAETARALRVYDYNQDRFPSRAQELGDKR